MWGLPYQIWLLGLISLFGDIASEMLYPVIPLYLTAALGASYAAVGMVESAAELTAAVLKYYSGKWIDQGAKGKPLIIAGYALSNFSKPWVGFTTHWFQVLVVRSLDRFGKGVRTTPRDHILATAAPPEHRGLAFGLHRGMDSFGAMVGPLLCLAILDGAGVAELRSIFILSAIPGALTVLLAFFIREPLRGGHAHVDDETEVSNGRSLFGFSDFRRFAIVWTLFCLANSSDMFLILQVQKTLSDFKTTILIYCFFNLVYAIGGPLLGYLSDHWPRRRLLAAGFLLYAGIYVFVPFASTVSEWLWLYGLYGVFKAATEGVGKAFATDVLPRGYRGRGLGYVNAIGSAGLFVSSVGTGLLWDWFGPIAAFGACSALSALAALLILRVRSTVQASAT